MTFSRPHSITVVRKVENTYNSLGQPVQGSTTATLSLKANIQPMKGDELLMLPEGDRTTTTLKMYTVEEIKLNDKITYLTKNYIAIPMTQAWQGFNSSLNHYKTALKRIES